MLFRSITSDLAEAISILLTTLDYNHPIWKLQIDNLDLEAIVPEKALYWLSGGHKEWSTLEHYAKTWSECYLDFQEEFGFMIIRSLKKSKNFEEIRDYFLKYMNLPILYDFAISKNLIR